MQAGLAGRERQWKQSDRRREAESVTKRFARLVPGKRGDQAGDPHHAARWIDGPPPASGTYTAISAAASSSLGAARVPSPRCDSTSTASSIRSGRSRRGWWASPERLEKLVAHRGAQPYPREAHIPRISARRQASGANSRPRSARRRIARARGKTAAPAPGSARPCPPPERRARCGACVGVETGPAARRGRRTRTSSPTSATRPHTRIRGSAGHGLLTGAEERSSKPEQDATAGPPQPIRKGSRAYTSAKKR